MRLSARAEYAMHALVELAAAGETLIPAEQLAQEQGIPGKVLEAVMTELRRAGLVLSQRGPDGGFSLARQATDISLAEIVSVLRAL
jgi:Rrf2 family protein